MKHLNFGVYKTTETFRAIENHCAICFDDMTLVAVTGPAEDLESKQYAELFVAAPKMLEILRTIISNYDNGDFTVICNETKKPANFLTARLLISKFDNFE
jgi:hypothetical protein